MSEESRSYVAITQDSENLARSSDELMRDASDLERRRQTMRRAKILTAVVLVLLAVGAGRTVMSRMSNAKVLEAGIAENSTLYVKTTKPKSAGAGQTLALPGTLQGS